MVIFTPSATLNGSTSSLPMIAFQNITLPNPSWRLIRWGRGASVKYHPLLHPSGTSKIAWHLLVNKPDWNLPSCDFLPTPFSFSYGYPLMEGEPLVSHILQRFSGYGIEQIILLHYFQRLFLKLHKRFQRLFLFVWRGLQQISLLILLMAQCDTGDFLRIFPLSERPLQSSGLVTNFLNVLWLRCNCLASCKVDIFLSSLWTYLDFSVWLKAPYVLSCI